jgi:hypothetical protein
MKRILTALLMAILLLAGSAGSCLASSGHAVDMDDFIPEYENCIADYALFGAAWNASNWKLIKQERRIGYFDYDGLLIKCELYKRPGHDGNSLRLLSAKIPLKTKAVPGAAGLGARYRIIALIATLENTLPIPKSVDRTDLLSDAASLYDEMLGSYSVHISPKDMVVPLHRGRVYNYFYVYEDSVVPAFFMVEIIK